MLFVVLLDGGMELTVYNIVETFVVSSEGSAFNAPLEP